MSVILRPQLWRRQPNVPVVVDENHRYAAFIEAAFLPSVNWSSFLYNAARPDVRAVRDGTITTTSAGGRHGIAYRTSTTSFEYAYTVSGVRSVAGSHKNICFVLNRVASGTVALSAGPGDNTKINASLQPELSVASSIRATGTAITPEMPLILGFSFKDNQYRIYQDGLRTADGTGGFGSGPPLAQLGGIGGGLNSVEQDMAFVLYGTDVEFDYDFQVAFNENPWHVLKPRQRRVYVDLGVVAVVPAPLGQFTPLLVKLDQRLKGATRWAMPSIQPSPAPLTPPVAPVMAPLLARFERLFGRQQMGRLSGQAPVSGPQLYLSSLSGALAFVGALIRGTAHTGEAGALSFAGALARLTATARTAAISFSGAHTGRAGKALAGTLSFVGARGATSIAKGIAGTLPFAGSLVRAIALAAKTATLNFVGDLAKRTATARTATLSFVGAMLTGKAFLRTLTATLSFAGSASRLPQKALTATLSFAGTLVRATTHAMSAALAFAGSQTRRTVLAAKTATLAFVGSLTGGHLFVKALTGTLSFAGSLARQAGKALAGALSFAGAIRRLVGAGQASVLAFAGALARVTTAVQAIFGWGARGRVGAASASDRLKRIGSESATDSSAGIGSETAKAQNGKIGGESA